MLFSFFFFKFSHLIWKLQIGYFFKSLGFSSTFISGLFAGTIGKQLFNLSLKVHVSMSGGTLVN